MTAIGIDTHKATLACCLVDDLGSPLDERTLPDDPTGHAGLIAWVRSLDPPPLVGLEGSASYGAAAARALVAAGLEAREVPPMLSRRERRTTRRVGKSDPGDALAIARVVARERELPPVRTEDPSTELALLVSARDRLLAEATRVRNGVHAQLLVLLPGYAAAAPNLVAARYRRTIRGGLRGRTGVRADLVRADLDRLERLGREARALERSIAARVAGHPLLGVPGCGAITAATLLGRIGDVARIGSHDRLAMLAGVAPVPASSGQVRRVRLNRGGDRRLNRAFYTIAFTQVRCHPRRVPTSSASVPRARAGRRPSGASSASSPGSCSTPSAQGLPEPPYRGLDDIGAWRHGPGRRRSSSRDRPGGRPVHPGRQATAQPGHSTPFDDRPVRRGFDRPADGRRLRSSPVTTCITCAGARSPAEPTSVYQPPSPTRGHAATVPA